MQEEASLVETAGVAELEYGGGKLAASATPSAS